MIIRAYVEIGEQELKELLLKHLRGQGYDVSGEVLTLVDGEQTDQPVRVRVVLKYPKK